MKINILTLFVIFCSVTLMGCSKSTVIAPQNEVISPGAEDQTDPQQLETATSQQYQEYSAAGAVDAATNGKAVIFFAASWCPTCQAADRAFSAADASIPAGVTILKADYDKETDLKKKYGVTYQHTFVQIDASGNQITKWNGGDISELEQRIQ